LFAVLGSRTRWKSQPRTADARGVDGDHRGLAAGLDDDLAAQDSAPELDKLAASEQSRPRPKKVLLMIVTPRRQGG
jgi:hypothetical protein